MEPPSGAPVAARLDKFLLAFALASFALHLLPIITGGYGYFRDELYYLACAQHPAIGYVDHPPLSIWILGAFVSLFGDSLFALRTIPAIVGALIVYVVGVLTKELGGGRFAQGLACLSSLFAPVILGMTSIYNMNPYDILLWLMAAYTVVRLVKTGRTELWFALGVVVGLGLLNKISMGWLAVGIAIGFNATSERRWLKSPYPYIAALIAALIFLPFVLWNATHDWAHMEFMRRAAQFKYESQNPLTFVVELFLINNPLALPVWLAGFWFLLKTKAARVLGIAILTVLAILIVNVHSKGEYFTPAVAILFAAGSVQLEQTFRGAWGSAARKIYPALIALAGIVLLPLTLAILPVKTYLQYQHALGIEPPSTEGHELPGLPQHYADRFGWEEIARETARIYESLSPEEKSITAIVTTNYGRASAINFFNRGKGLPYAMAQHNSYYYWGLGQYRGESIFIIVRRNSADLNEVFERIELRGEVPPNPYQMPYESGLKIFVCRGIKIPFADAWKAGRTFI